MGGPPDTPATSALFVLAAALAAAAGCFERGTDGDEEHPNSRVTASPAATAEPDAPLARDPDAPADPDAEITIALEAEPAHLQPLLTNDVVTTRVVLGDVYQGLLCFDEDGATEPCLASSYEVSGDGRTWTFRIRDGVTWHDGEPFDAEDVAFTFAALRDERITSPHLAEIDDLLAVDVVDGDGDAGEVVVRFAGFRTDRRGTFARIPIVPAHRYDGDPGELAAAATRGLPIGTGPLRVTAFDRGDRIALERAPGAWGEPARARAIVYRVVPSLDRRLRGVASGELDLAVQLPVDRAARAAREHDDVTLFRYRMPAYTAAVYNLRRAELASADARRALGMLLDRPGVVAELLGGHGEVARGPFLQGDGDPGIDPLPFDPEAARRVLGERRPELAILVPSESRTTARIADIWVEDARGIADLRVERAPWAEVLERVRGGDFDIALMSFTSGRDLDLYPRFHGSQVGGGNWGAVRDAVLDRALERVRTEPDEAARRRARRAVHRRLDELQPFTFITADVRVGVVRRGVGGVAGGGPLPPARTLWKGRAP